ncbi:MAG: zinc ribbon domain-containing protein [Thermoplasmata archaeon]|nr:zinc ribbon domain-containing protein [Thermoplasmata archaeon]MCI4356152.1 zinc ribbon domain-containing protein [Thermoplasmata archaeon]
MRPTESLVLCIIGGILILAAAGLEVAIGTVVPQNVPFGSFGGTLVLSGLFGIVCGILVLLFGAMVYTQPQHHVLFGVLIIVFSVLSLTSFAGGFVVGFILGLIGGALAIAHQPHPRPTWMPYLPPPPVLRVCPKCGRVIDPNVRFCPHCGNPLG